MKGSSLNSLTLLAPPPKRPSARPSNLDWCVFEARWGFRPPDDYIGFIETYGDGRFKDFFGILVPAVNGRSRPEFEGFVKTAIAGLEMAMSEYPDLAPKWQAYPSLNGLFPIGYTDNEGTLYYLRNDCRTKYSIVALGPENLEAEALRYDLSLPDFISDWIQGNLNSGILTPSGFFPLVEPVFKPSIPGIS